MLALVLLVYLVVEVAHLIIAGIIIAGAGSVVVVAEWVIGSSSVVVVVVIAEWVIGSSSGGVIVFE